MDALANGWFGRTGVIIVWGMDSLVNGWVGVWRHGRYHGLGMDAGGASVLLPLTKRSTSTITWHRLGSRHAAIADSSAMVSLERQSQSWAMIGSGF